MKVYLVIFEYELYGGTFDVEVRVASTLEKAKEIFEELKKDTVIDTILEDPEFCKLTENSIYAYDYDNMVRLHIVEKAVE